MKRKSLLTITIVSLLALGLTGVAQAQIKISDTEDTKLYITLATVGTFQTLDQKNVYDTKGVAMPSLTSGMQTAFGDLGFAGKFGRKRRSSATRLPSSSRRSPSSIAIRCGCSARRRNVTGGEAGKSSFADDGSAATLSSGSSASSSTAAAASVPRSRARRLTADVGPDAFHGLHYGPVERRSGSLST